MGLFTLASRSQVMFKSLISVDRIALDVASWSFSGLSELFRAG